MVKIQPRVICFDGIRSRILSSLPGFKNFQPWVELGDGGESLVGQAAAHGDVQFAEIGEPER